MPPQVPLVVFHSCPEAAKVVREQYRGAVKAAVVELIPPERLAEVQWAKTVYFPTIADWEVFASGGLRVGGLEKTSAAGRLWLFQNEAHRTEVEKMDGRMPGISRARGAPGGIFSAGELAALFQAQVLPAKLEHSTRKAYWGVWKQVLTWGLAHGIMNQLLPMSMDDVHAMVMEMMMLGLSASSIKNVLSCVESRHRFCGLVPPLVQAKAFARLTKSVASVAGAPGRLRFPLGTHHLRRMIALPGPSRLELRAILIACVGTVSVSRVEEVANMQLCDLLWSFDAAYHFSLLGTLAIRIIRRKQDCGRFGLYVRIPAGPLVELLRAFVVAMGLRLDPRCTKLVHRGARCPYCDPVWPKTVVGRTAAAGPGPIAAMSRQQVSGAVKVAMESICVDPRHYSGISMRRGGVTAAVQANIAPAILHLQSGHGTATSSAKYVEPVDPRVLYQTGAAILGP